MLVTTSAAGSPTACRHTRASCRFAPIGSAKPMPDRRGTPAVDAVVVGGGPAGAVAGARLAQLGHSVCIVERSAGSGDLRVESLSPGVWPVLQMLGWEQRVREQPFPAVESSLLCWTSAAV